MRIALGIPRLVPAGGLEQNCLSLAERLEGRGHAVTLYASAGLATAPAGIATVRLAASGASNHRREAQFAAAFAAATAGRFDRVVGFKRMPGLDVLYCADPSFIATHRSPLARLSPRYRTFAALERACFGRGSGTRIIGLSAPQIATYEAVHGTPRDRLAILPPTVEPRRHQPGLRAADTRRRLRAERGLPDGPVWLWIGLQPRIKGLDRVVEALAAVPEATLLVVGPEPAAPSLRAIRVAASRNGTLSRIRFAGFAGPEELPRLLALADVLMHPARADVTGTVILEALVNGLPAIASAACGYSPYVAASGGGLAIPEPFAQPAFDAMARRADAATCAAWSAALAGFGDDPALFSGLDRACDLIEAAADANAWRSLSGV